MRDPDVDGGLDLPLTRRLAAHRFTEAQLVAIDVAAVVLITVLFEFFRPLHSPTLSGTAWDTAGWVAYAVGSVVVLFRRRLPRATLAIVLPVAVLALCLGRGGPATFYVVMALYSFVAVSSRRASLVTVSLSAGAIVAATVVGGGDMVVEVVVGNVAVVLVGWLAGENTRASRAYAGQRAERAAEKAAAAAAERTEQVRRVLADERAQIARELHDIVAHAMSVIAVRSGVARMVIDTDPQQAREALSIIETTTRRSLHEMRLLVSVLRDTGDRDLDRLVATTAAAGVTVEVTIEGTARVLSPAADLSAYRIVQEALTNVVRHAGPTRAQVQRATSASPIWTPDHQPQGHNNITSATGRSSAAC
jgi:signal transduction histidine kinase